MARKSKSQMTLKSAIPEGNIASKLFDELSHSAFNFGNSADSSISTKALGVITLQARWDAVTLSLFIANTQG
ncbi:hypothetical protein KY290_033417 [Solanum tuberosum]|uniref:Uncharacterized protein n=1 Tax=Solanum tuberosum TaxID=4113 RepID=A0ABQ7U257_SOLTU|nr:hypothetical protein KY285_032667 [Solanum tuberosum]KAH0740374.1 hypothetical protein KY290_033417 [Solanum tuberosum]